MKLVRFVWPVVTGTCVLLACSRDDRGGFVVPPLPAAIAPADAGAIPPPPGCAGKKCSRDLHAVLDGCTDEVLERCAPELGCNEGSCVPACVSAAGAQGSIGCSFFAIPPDVPRYLESSCYAAIVTNTWTTPVTVTGDYRGVPLDLTKSVYRATAGADRRLTYERIDGPIPPGEVGVVFLSQGTPDASPEAKDAIACPEGVQEAYFGVAVAEHATSRYDAFHLETDAPVSAYSIFPYGGADSFVPSATLLLPTSSWDTNYLLVDGWSQVLPEYSNFIQVVASEDDTEVRLRPFVSVSAGKGVLGAPSGVVSTWTMQRGEVLEFVQRTSLAGSPLESSKPVAIFGGNQCVYIPSGFTACDSLQQQIPPLSQWGARYSAVPATSRKSPQPDGARLPETVPYRLVGARDGTTLVYDPVRPVGAPIALSTGQVTEFESEVPFTVRSQGPDFPFYAAVYMTGATFGTGSVSALAMGDPDFVNLVPDEQFLDAYVFFVDHTYANSTLTVVRRADAGGFHDVQVDCLGVLGGFQPLGGDGELEIAWVDLTRAGQGIGTCRYGRHEASSEGAFGLYVWGVDNYASYGFPAGAGSRPTTRYKVEVR